MSENMEDLPGKREKIENKKKNYSRPSWDEAFMFSALWFAARSSCRYLNTGVVIVKDKRIIASGYNGAPPGIANCLERGCRKDREGIEFEDKGKSVCRGVHAEINAMSQIPRNDLKGAIIYSVFFPCTSCAKAIVANGISEVVYLEIYQEPDSLALELFAEAGIKIRQLRIDVEKQFNIIIDIINQRGR